MLEKAKKNRMEANARSMLSSSFIVNEQKSSQQISNQITQPTNNADKNFNQPNGNAFRYSVSSQQPTTENNEEQVNVSCCLIM